MTTNNQFLIQLLSLRNNYFSDLASSRDNDASLATNSLETLEATSIIQDDQILDAEILVEEVEVALRLLKLGRSKGADGLSAEHLIYGGTAIVLWLKKIFNRIISLEEVPSCLKEGVIQSQCIKEKGRTQWSLTAIAVLPYLLSLLRRSRLLFSIECLTDSVSLTSIKLLSKKGSHAPMQYLAHKKFYFITSDKVKAHFSASMTLKRPIEFPVLLSHLQSIGISGKSWRLIKSWYDSPTSRVKLHNRVSDPFLITRGVKQGSVLSPSLFLVVMNTLIQKLRSISCGASLQGINTGTAIHADDVRCIAPNVQSLLTQSSEIQSFTDEVGLKLKLEVIRISQIPSKESTQVKIGKDVIAPSRSARCLGVQWQHNLSASESVKVNIGKHSSALVVQACSTAN